MCVRAVSKVEVSEPCRAILLARLRDGSLPPGAVFSDVKSFFPSSESFGDCTGLTAGFPCQAPGLQLDAYGDDARRQACFERPFWLLLATKDISHAGLQQGLSGSRSGLVCHIWRIADAMRDCLQLKCIGVGSVGFGNKFGCHEL